MLKLEREQTRRGSPDESIEQQGHFIFESNCRACHGSDLKGSPPAIPSLRGIATRFNQEQIERLVRQGRGPMPGFPRLSEADMQSLIAFVLNPSRASALPPVAVVPPAAATESGVTPDSGPVHYLSGFGFLMTSTGVPAIKPPWTSLTAYDLNKGIIKWQIPLGDVPDLAAKNIRDTGFPFPRTGPVATAGGLIFTATRDHCVRAYDAETGKVLWEKRLDAALQGIPSVYEAGGREYLVVCAAAPEVSDAALQAPIHGAYVAFALPRRR
jgi:quinoprotein glucose dehydrogenase